MIDISEKDLLEYLEKYANKEISMPQLENILKANQDTLNKKIIELSIDYPDLYYKIIINHPYKQGTRTDIDFEGLIIYILKNHLMIQDAEEIFNVSRRTIQRRVNEFKDIKPDLYYLFKNTVGKGPRKKITKEQQEEIDRLEFKEVVIGEINDEREAFLLEIEVKYNTLKGQGKDNEEIAKELGYTSSYLYKILNQLYRLKIEKDVKENNKSNCFRENLSDMTKYSANTDESTQSIDIEHNDLDNVIENNNNEAR